MVRSRTPDSKDISRFRGSNLGACELLTKERLGPGRPVKVLYVEGGWYYIREKFDKDRISNKGTGKIKIFQNARLHDISNLGVEISEIYGIIVVNLN